MKIPNAPNTDVDCSPQKARGSLRPKIASPHSVDWTIEKVAAFWDFYASRTDHHSQYFSSRVGEAMVHFAAGKIPSFGTIADYGAGPGFLLPHLLAESDRVWALDYSRQSLSVLQDKYGLAKNFAGIAEIDTHTRESLRVDCVFCLETVEHLLPEYTDSTIGFISDILRPGGHVVVSVPHNERLTDSDTFCPECHSVFHRYQHMTSWNTTSLRKTMERGGFSTVFCEPTNIYAIQNQIDAEREYQRDWWGGRSWQWFLRLIDMRKHAERCWSTIRPARHDNKVPTDGPNLVYVGRRL